MLNKLIRLSLAQRALVLAASLVILVLGVKKTLELPVDVLPDLTKTDGDDPDGSSRLCTGRSRNVGDDPIGELAHGCYGR